MNTVSEAPNLRIATPALEELMPQLLQLSADARLEVIARLSQSLKSAPAAATTLPTEKSLLDFAGAWSEMPGTDEEIMSGIRAARHFTRPEISLD